MNPKLIPFKHRKHVLKLIKEYKDNIGDVDHFYTEWNGYLLFRLNGTNDGWLETNNREYQALLWLIGINDMMTYLNK